MKPVQHEIDLRDNRGAIWTLYYNPSRALNSAFINSENYRAVEIIRYKSGSWGFPDRELYGIEFPPIFMSDIISRILTEFYNDYLKVIMETP